MVDINKKIDSIILMYKMSVYNSFSFLFNSFPFLPNMAFLRMKTPDGHGMADVYSCLQKYVRRGEFSAAVYWAGQLALPHGDYKGYPNALKKRLMQHALEDVGSLEYATAILQAKVASWEDLTSWLYCLCVMPKTRAAAWLNRLAVEYVGGAEIPEDAPVSRAVLQKSAEVLRLHRDGNRDALKALNPTAYRVYREINDEVLAYHVDILVSAGLIPKTPIPVRVHQEIPAAWMERQEVPEWAYDKHTARGKQMGRGYAHFFETMVLAPRIFSEEDLLEAAAKALYLNGKEQRVRHILAATKASNASDGSVIYEISEGTENEKAKMPVIPTSPPPQYTNILQAQALTGRNKARVWFATAPDGLQVVIKGPVPATEMRAVEKSENFKKLLGLPHANLRVEGKYLVWNSLVDYTKLPTKIMTTKLETDIRVPAENISHWTASMLRTEMERGMLEALLFRKIVGTNDTCDRNLLVVDNKVYSIDDASLCKDTPYMWKKGLIKPKAAYEAALERHWTHMETTIATWKTLLHENDFAMQQLDRYGQKSNWIW